MANTLQLKNDIKKIKSALASKGLSATFKNKLKVKLEKAESDLKNSTPKGAKATLTSLKEQVKKRGYGVYKGAGVDLQKDAKEPALAIGRRVSKGIKGNQYGNKKSSKGNVYYEYRANRLDVKQPSKTAKYPKLAEGGEIDEDYRYELNDFILEKYKGKTVNGFKLNPPGSEDEGSAFNWELKRKKLSITANPYWDWEEDLTIAVYKNEDEYLEQEDFKYPLTGNLEKDTEKYIELLKPYFVKYSGKMEQGGMMAHGGENTTELQKYLDIASERAFAGGGNGVNITDYGLSEAAGTIDMYHDIYTTETKTIFKKLVDSMVKDEIKNNQVGANDYKKGGMMAHGGKLSKKDFFKKYEENEDENMHTENVVLLAENYGTESDIRDAKTILAKHESIGHLPTSLRQERDVLHDKLYAKYVQSREDGGMMADGGKVYSTDMKPHFSGTDRYIVKIDKDEKVFTSSKEFNDYTKKLDKEGYKKMAEGGKLKFTTMTEESFLDKYSDTNVYPESVQNTFDIIRYGSNDKNKLDGFLSAMKLNGYKVKEKDEFALAVKKRNIKEDGGMMAEGGVTEKEVVDSNAQMVLSNVKEVKHHADELSKVVTKKSNIEAWVVAKIERASTDLSDVTHYLEGQHDKMSMGGSVYNHLHKMDKK